MATAQQFLWWQQEVIYQIYPRSFQDSNADGIGDLNGIRMRLDYLAGLGIKAIWLSPIFPSPMADFGYDISDYKDIHPLFGTLADFDKLVHEIHARGMKLIVDLVPNHTSDRHPWFIESCSSRSNPRRDWYLWHNAQPDGSVPNNWLAAFGGSAWTWHEQTQQYYYHAFLKEQPDLNWRNPQVQEAMFDVMRFWLDHGVDGFRIDVLWHLIKDASLRDNPPNPDYQPHMATYDQLLPVYSTDQHEVHDIVGRMRKLLDQYDNRMMIGEIYLPIHKLVTYYGTANNGAHLPFNFQLISLPWSSKNISAAVQEYEAALPKDTWPNWVLGNHDQPRIASRVGYDQARIAAMMLLTLRGTPTLYYGDELGMRDVPIPPHLIRDPQGLNMPDKNLSRDPARTPMMWNDHARAGFTTASETWLPIDRNWRTINAAAQHKDPFSMLALYQKLIRLRQQEPALRLGSYAPVHTDHQLFSYIRHHNGSPAFMVVLNLTHRTASFRPTINFQGTVEISTAHELEGQHVQNRIELAGDEGVIIKLDPEAIDAANTNRS